MRSKNELTFRSGKWLGVPNCGTSFLYFSFSFGIMRKEEKEMWIDSNVMALILFAVWFVFGWAYMSEMDRLEELESADDED